MPIDNQVPPYILNILCQITEVNGFLLTKHPVPHAFQYSVCIHKYFSS